MDATGVNEGAKAAIGTLKESISIGKEGGKLVEGVQADAHAVILQQRRIREHDRRRQEQVGSQQEQRAYQHFVAKRQELKNTEELKRHILKEHGVAGWAEFLKAKAHIEAQDKTENAQVSEDEHRMNDLTWWCFAAGALLAHLIVNG
jgi:hypothetical protein